MSKKPGKKSSPYAPSLIKPISAAELVAQAQRIADEEARHRREQADAEQTFRASLDAITPADPFAAILTRLDRIERALAKAGIEL